MFLLVSLASCALKPFVKEGWLQTRLESNKEKPLFAIVWAGHCGACTGIPEEAERFANEEGNRDDCDVSLIDCDTDGCDVLPATGTPNFILVQGKDWRDWKKTKARTGPEWNKFIDKYLKANVTEEESDFEDLVSTTNDENGAAVFEVIAPTKEDPLIARLQGMTKYYAISGAEFRYRVDPSVKKAKLIAIRSPTCHVEHTNFFQHIGSFIDSNKRSLNYELKYDYWKRMASTKKMAIYLTSEERPTTTDHTHVAKDKCNDAFFGWMTTHKQEEVLELTGIRTYELPGVLVTDPVKKCAWFTKDVYNGQQECQSRFDDMWESGSLNSGTEIGLPGGLEFSYPLVFGFLGVCLSLSVIMLYLSRDKGPKRKDE